MGQEYMAHTKPLNIVVTGGMGYIGSILTELLLENHYHVEVIDTNQFNQSEQKGVSYHYLDLTSEFEKAISVLKTANVIVHLAAVVGEPACQKQPQKAFDINYLVTKKLAEFCKLHSIKLIFASTCSLYGNQEGILTEESPVRPIDFYGFTKQFAEKEVINNNPELNVALRMGSNYGVSKRQRFDLVLNKFTAQATNKESITVYGGKQKRPFIHVRDAARVFLWAIEKNLCGIYNVPHINMSISEGANEIAKLLNAPVSIIEQEDDQRNYQVSSEKILNTGFSFNGEFNESIKELSADIMTHHVDYRDSVYYNDRALHPAH